MRDSWQYFTVSVLRLRQYGGLGPRIYVVEEQGGPVIPLALGSLFVASYDSQGYGGGIRARLHAGIKIAFLVIKYIKVEPVPHRKHITSLLQRLMFRETAAVCCETIQDARINSVGTMQCFSVLMQVVHIVTIGL
jgi:hypothetical protein